MCEKGTNWVLKENCVLNFTQQQVYRSSNSKVKTSLDIESVGTSVFFTRSFNNFIKSGLILEFLSDFSVKILFFPVEKLRFVIGLTSEF